MRSNTVRHFDVVIVGAGVAGLVAAIDMACGGLQVALVESREFKETSGGQHVRVSALNIVSERILEHLACWKGIENKKVSQFREIAVRDAEGSGHVEFSYRDVGRAYLGHIVANDALITALLQRAEILPTLTFFCPVEIDALIIDEAIVKLKLANGDALQTKLLVGADGAHSWVRKSLNIPVEELPYDHTAVLATVKTTRPHQSIARQRFRLSGPIALLPLQDSCTCSIVWSTSPKEAEALMRDTPDVLADKIAAAIDNELGKVIVIDKPLSFPLTMRHVTHYVHPRVALIGDAAHTIHPLAGQGMNLGILDAACLSEVVVTHFKAQRDIGLIQNLRRYERWRRGDNQTMIEAMRFFKEGFAVQEGFLKKFRDVTLRLTNRNRWLRKIFMHNAMGFRGELPRTGL
jgi:2-octaprenylphenol hydroxylase